MCNFQHNPRRIFEGSAVEKQRTRAMKTPARPTLEAMPSEIQDTITSFLPQHSLHTLMLMSPALSEAAAISLYRCPTFTSTYRLAQFVTTVSHTRHYADMVRTLSLDDRKWRKDSKNQLAGWREWKYRSLSFFAALSPSQHATTSSGIHPRHNRMLPDACGDVPFGALFHLCAVCKNIRFVL